MILSSRQTAQADLFKVSWPSCKGAQGSASQSLAACVREFPKYFQELSLLHNESLTSGPYKTNNHPNNNRKYIPQKTCSRYVSRTTRFPWHSSALPHPVASRTCLVLSIIFPTACLLAPPAITALYLHSCLWSCKSAVAIVAQTSGTCGSCQILLTRISLRVLKQFMFWH